MCPEYSQSITQTAYKTQRIEQSLCLPPPFLFFEPLSHDGLESCYLSTVNLDRLMSNYDIMKRGKKSCVI